MKVLTALSVFLLIMSGASYGQDASGMKHDKDKMMNEMKSHVTRAVCVLSPVGSGHVSGMVVFEAVDGGVKVTANVTGLTPGKHGFHIHEFGDCSSPDFKSAGSHLMMKGEVHAGPKDPKRHIGDMGNLTADADGNAHLTLVDDKLSFSGPMSILGRAIIVHEGEDDMSTQPTGNAGGRVACGTIGISKPQ